MITSNIVPVKNALKKELFNNEDKPQVTLPLVNNQPPAKLKHNQISFLNKLSSLPYLINGCQKAIELNLIADNEQSHHNIEIINCLELYIDNENRYYFLYH